jgi:hypothetical protein
MTTDTTVLSPWLQHDYRHNCPVSMATGTTVLSPWLQTQLSCHHDYSMTTNTTVLSPCKILSSLPQLQELFFTSALDPVIYIQCYTTKRVNLYFSLIYQCHLLMLCCIKCSMLIRIFSLIHYLTESEYRNNDNDSNEAWQKSERLFYKEEIYLQRVFDITSIFSCHYHSTNSPHWLLPPWSQWLMGRKSESVYNNYL